MVRDTTKPTNLTIKYSYRDVPTIRAFSESNAFMRGLMGPFGSGKSVGCSIEIAKRAMEQKPGPDGVARTRWAVVRNSYRQLTDTTIKTFHQWLPPPAFGEWRVSDMRYIVRLGDNVEAEILFRALDRPDQVGNLLSLELTGAWVNEAREVPWAIVEALQARVGRYPSKREGQPTWFGIFMDTNPPDVDSRWFKFFEEGNHPEHFARIFKQPSGLADDAENLGNLPNGRGYYENLSRGKDPEWIKVYIHGQYGFVIDGRPVFPEYADHWHCKAVKPVKGSDIVVGLDFGLTPAAILTQITPGGQFVVVDELCATDMGFERFADELLTKIATEYPGYNVIYVGDPAGAGRSQTDERTCFEIGMSKGMEIIPGPQTVQIRLESVRKPLRSTAAKAEPMFLIDPRCKLLRRALSGGYQYRRLQVSSDRFTSVPDKNAYSHPADALQYAAGYIFGGSLTVGDAPGVHRPSQQEIDYFNSEGRNEISGY